MPIITLIVTVTFNVILLRRAEAPSDDEVVERLTDAADRGIGSHSVGSGMEKRGYVTDELLVFQLVRLVRKDVVVAEIDCGAVCVYGIVMVVRVVEHAGAVEMARGRR